MNTPIGFSWLAFAAGAAAGGGATVLLVLASMNRAVTAVALRTIGGIFLVVPVLVNLLDLMGGGRPTIEVVLAVPVGFGLLVFLHKIADVIEPSTEVAGS